MDFDDRIRELEDQQGSPEEDHLLYEQVTAYAPAGTNPGVNSTFRALFDSGRVGYHKPFAGVSPVHASAFQHHPDEVPINECTAWRLAYRVGAPYTEIVAPTVLRAIHGEPGSVSAQKFGNANDPQLFMHAPHLAHAAAFFDSLIAQQDRHFGNMRWDAPAQKLGLIDHGYTFALPGNRLNAAVFVDWRWAAGAQTLETTETDALTALIGSGDLHRLRLFMLPDRADQLQDRAERMLASGAILPRHDF